MLKAYWTRFLDKRHPRTGRRCVIHQRQLYILPTSLCWAYALVCALIGLGATNYQLSLAYFLGFLLAGMAFSALLHIYSALYGLQVEIQDAAPVFAGEAAQFPVCLHNTSQRRREGIMLGQDTDTLSGPQDLAPGGQIYCNLPISTTTRGLLRLPRLLIENRTPTGWFRAWSYLALEAQCLVYPQPEAEPPSLPFSAANTASGTHSEQLGDEEFSGLRDYRPGDAQRLIAWKQVARLDKLVSKQYQSNQSTQVGLDWLALASLPYEMRIARLTAWVLQAEEKGCDYALTLPGQSLSASQGMAHREACLRALALLPQEAAP